MPLELSIDNLDRLPDGGPLTYTMRGQNRAEIGRDAHLDWCLPDPQRFVSGKHCEINREGDEYYLVDLSTNGTFVNGAATRVQSPYRLKNGDRLQIGEYLISVALVRDDGSIAREPQPAPAIDRPASYEALWDADGDAAPPADPKDFRPARKHAPVYSDFLFHAADAPRMTDAAQFSPRSAADPGVPAPEPFRVPEPRRRRIEEVGWDDAPPSPVAVAPPPAAAPLPPVAVAPPPRSVPQPEGRVARPRAPAPSEAGVLEAFAEAAGLPKDYFAGRDPVEVAELVGRTMRVVVEEMKQLLQARAQAKTLARSADHTVIEPRENNPLKFSPTPDDALRILFGPPTASYLGAERALAQGFADVRRHQAQSFSAMQQAVRRMIADLDPARIEAASPAPGGVAALMRSHKSALWDAYVAAWKAQGGGAEDIIQRFMFLFGKHYDGAG